MGFEDTFENAQQSKSQTNAIIATTHLPMHTFLGVIRKNVMGKVSKNLTQMFFPHMCSKLHIQPEDNLCGFYHTCVVFHTYVWK